MSKTRYLKNIDELHVNLLPIKAVNMKKVKVELEVLIDVTSKGLIADLIVPNLKSQMANQVTVNQKQNSKVSVGDPFLAIVNGKEISCMLIQNVQFSSWNIVDLETGLTLFGRDIRNADVLSKQIKDLDIELVDSITINKEQK